MKSSSHLLYALLSAALLLLAFQRCSDDTPTEPPPDDNDTTAVHQQQDTTSHDITWEVFEFGPAGPNHSVIRDIYALNDTCVWAVGEIVNEHAHEVDSLGRWDQHYNAVHWNGKEWTLHRINAEKTWWGVPSYKALFSVYLFEDGTNLAVDQVGQLQFWNHKDTLKKITPQGTRRGSIYKIWGTSPDNIYLAGSNGSLTHYTNGQFRLIETWTDVPLNGIYGLDDHRIWTGGYTNTPPARGAFFRIKDGFSFPRWSPNLYGASAIYAFGDSLYTFNGRGFCIRSINDTSHWRYVEGESFADEIGWIEAMRGTGHNNIFAAGHFKTLIHYNGISWRMLFPFTSANKYTEEHRVVFYAVTVTERNVYAAGVNNVSGQAVIYKGTLR